MPMYQMHQRGNSQQEIIGLDSSSQGEGSVITLLVLVPWVLTVGALLFIIVRQQQHHNSSNEFLDHDIFDENDLITEDSNQHAIIRVAVYEDRAYWVYQNVLYESEVTREPDWDTAKPVDVMALPQKDINKLLTVLDELQDKDEGE
jgi:hypothetical protein